MRSKENLLVELSRCVVDMEDEEVTSVAEEYVAAGYPVLDGIVEGLVAGMKKVSQQYEEEEYFIPELLICSDALYNGLAVLRPHLPQDSIEEKHKIVLGVVEGDTHDIGKNLVRIMLEASGYEVHDLGRDVPLHSFVNKAREVQAEIIAMSTLMSTTMSGMKRVVEILEEEGMREQVKVIVGGAPISPAYAEKIGADGYSPNAVEAVKLVDQIIRTRNDA